MQVLTDVKEGFEPCSVTIKIENENDLGFLWATFNIPFNTVYKNGTDYRVIKTLSSKELNDLSYEQYQAWKALDNLMIKFKMR